MNIDAFIDNIKVHFGFILCNGSVFPFTQTDEQSIWTDGQMLSLQDQTNRMPSIANPPEKWMPQGTQFTSQLYGILPVNGPDLRYLYIYGTGTPSTSQSPLQLHYCAKSLPIVELEIQRYHSYWHSQFCSGFSFLLDLTHRV